MIYQLRTYWAAPGKAEALHARFRNLTTRIFARHGMEMLGFWSPQPVTEESGDLVYLMRFASVEALEAGWNAFRADPEWIAGRAESEKDGTLVTKITNYVLSPTDYSALK